MTLQGRLTITFLGGILVILPLAQIYQHHHARQAGQQIAAASLSLLQERERQSVENTERAVDMNVADALGRGDMDVFGKLVRLQKEIPGFVEFSLYNADGRVTHSSDPAALKRSLDPQIKARLLASPEKLVRADAALVEVFRPQVVQKSCLECHNEYQEGKVCGVTYFRFANDATTRLASQVQQADARSRRDLLGDSILTLVLLMLALALLTWVSSRSVVRALRHVVGTLTQHGEQVRAAAEEVAASSHTVADGASEQAASLEETSSSLEEMSSMTKRNADNARQANALAQEARRAADTGTADMQAMSAAMGDLKAASGDIAKIIKTIDEIAFQTNILALNAAVEAARAGEAGMGFAVVADEVRNLAQRSAQAARETAAKIEGAIAKTALGVQISDRVRLNLREIVDKTRKVDELVAEVAAASQEQSQGIDQLTTAVTQMDRVTQTNAASAEGSASATEELNAQARALGEAVAELQSIVDGRRESPVASPPIPAAADRTEPGGFVPTPRRVPDGRRPSPAGAAPLRTIHSAPDLTRRSHAPAPASPVQASPQPGDSRSAAAPVSPEGGGTDGDLIRWDPARMATGVETVDGQHQELIAMINQLHRACQDGTGKDELRQMMAFLSDYVQSHFRHEESVMSEHQCPARGRNQMAHQKFLKSFGELVSEFEEKGATTVVLIRLKELVADWLTNHICTVDTGLRPCVGACAGKG